MIGRCSAFGLAVTAALLLAFPISASAATRGDLNIHADGTFATATANGVADVTLSGLVGIGAHVPR